jgi:asparagine synthase (glutamine-hydrolysing)
MCGIAGIASLDGRPVALDELRTMCAALAHRGPDDEGFHVGAGVGLGMRRLSIIGVDNGRQPVSNEDGSIRVVFNGEIYNYRELRDELGRRGHVFSTSTDTEVIAHLYEERGVRCISALRGMFAFALWDEPRRRLLLARDRLGIKPLYYTEAGGRLIFASELKAILALDEGAPPLDWAALDGLLTFQVTPRDASIVKGVRKLEPGHLLVAAPGRPPHTERYWEACFQPDHSKTEAQFVKDLRNLLEESVRLHLVSDVPVGAFLSGGTDSSAIVAMMSRLNPAPVQTFSIGFRDAAYNELDAARLVATSFGTDHRELVLEPDALGALEDIAWHLDEPFGDSSAIPTYMVSKLASERVKVVLSGDGGDELFAGYDKYAVEGRERRYRFLPGPARRMLGALSRRMPEGMRGRNYLRHMSLAGAERYLDASTLFRRDQLGDLLTAEAFHMVTRHDASRSSRAWLANGHGHWLSALQSFDLHAYLPLDILTKVDRMSMAHSVEARVPLLDHRLVEFAATIPPALQLRHGTRKYLFRAALQGVVPAPILARPKRGFAIPLGRWFRGGLSGFVRDLLLSERSRQRGIFDPAKVERLIEEPRRGQEDLDLQLWTLISLELWCRIFVDGGLRREVRAERARGAGREPALAAAAPTPGGARRHERSS